ncbi:hypothetical protein SDC9_90655 [bioreactor metagenome]|uniref:Prepilin type IV endopeptidase peptidase domain-containing protein n=1 Tax=bioreactor metagenome TaxID=1076179 RepID=A0A644ZT92_9ZZZZ
MIPDILILINAAALVYGGVVDFRRREIPNAVPVLLLVSGVFGFSGLWSILGLIAPAVLLFAAAKLTKSEVPGGDFKLLAALGFTCGLRELAVIIFLAGMGAVAYGLIRRLPVKRHIPLCTYLAPAYLAVQSIAFLIERTLLL